jgi:hypothetical protein
MRRKSKQDKTGMKKARSCVNVCMGELVARWNENQKELHTYWLNDLNINIISRESFHFESISMQMREIVLNLR